MVREAHQSQIPANAHGTPPEAVPEVALDMRHVFKLQVRRALGIVLERHGEPADPATKLPGHREAARRLATRDLSARIALELIAATELQLARNRQEPARNA